MKLYRANILFTPTPDAFKVLEHGYIAVNDHGLVEGVYDQLPAMYNGLPVKDFGDKLLIPAMNDLHVHAPQYRNQGIAMDLELLPWLQTYTFPEESKYKDLAYAEKMYRRFVRDLWAYGTMRTVAFATIHLPASKLLADIFTEAHMGAMIGLVGMNRNGPDTLSNTTEDVVRDTEALMNHLKGNKLVSAIVTPRFVPSCTPDMLDALGALAKKYNLPVQSHLSENRSEIAWVQELEPESTCYGDAYRRHGLFGDTPTLMAHCCYTEGEELRLMKEHNVFVVHCPTSNCNLASGMAPIRSFLDAGVPVALGSDISGGHHLSMFEVLRYVIQISKLKYAETKGELKFLTLSEAFYLATKSGGSFFGKVGSFENGYAFDALLIDDSELNIDNYSLPHRLERYVYLGDDRQIVKRFCAGKEIKEPFV